MILTKVSLKKLWAGLFLIALAILFAVVAAPIDNESGSGLFRFLGRFHVLVLHFPVVLLLLAPSVELLSLKKNFKSLKPIIPLLWLVGAISAIITVALGLMLAANEGFRAEQVQSHQLGGMSVALLALFTLGLQITRDRLNKSWISYTYTASSAGLVVLIMAAAHAGGNLVHGDTYLTQHTPEPIKSILGLHEQPVVTEVVDDPVFNQQVKPVMQEYCIGCHGPDKQKGNVRFDTLNPDMVNGHDAEQWHAALDMINSGEMPPAKEQQLSNEHRRVVVDWMTDNIKLASSARKSALQHPIRRLTKQQYTNSLQDLLGIEIDFGNILPDDGKSEMGFTNDGEILQMTSLHGEYFQSIAKQALLKAINLGDKPEVFHYRINFGQNISDGKYTTELDGYKEVPLDNKHFDIEMLDENGEVVVAQSEEEKAKFNALKKRFSISLRGSSYNRFDMSKEGIVLASALPHIEKQPYSSMGPSPNLKVQIKDLLPKEGSFQMRVIANKGELSASGNGKLQGLKSNKTLAKVNASTQSAVANKDNIIVNASTSSKLINLKQKGNFWLPENVKTKKSVAILKANIPENAYYQIDLVHPVISDVDVNLPRNRLKLTVGGRTIKTQLNVGPKNSQVSALALIYLNKGKQNIKLQANNFVGFNDIVLTKVPNNDKLLAAAKKAQAVNAQIFSDDAPSIQPFVGTRLDDGMDYQTFSTSTEVSQNNKKATSYTFTGRLENLPVPTSTDKNDRLSGIALIGLWNNFLVKESDHIGPPLQVKAIELEAPYFEQWPTKSHTNIFFESPNKENLDVYTKEVISQFAEKAFRRPLDGSELDLYLNFWQSIKGDYSQYEESVVEVMAAILTSPNFLYLPEEPVVDDSQSTKLLANFSRLFGISSANASSYQATPISEFALANRLSYFLWNSAPDQTLLDLAKTGQLSDQLSTQVDRMLEDPKVWRFIRPFAFEWLRVDRHQSMKMNVDQHPRFTRFVKADMAEETYQFIHHVLVEDKTIFNLVDSDFAMLNQNLAEYYGVNDVKGNEFRAVDISPEQHRGGLLSQGAFLAGHSDGEQAHPVKRAVWFKEKILGTPPPPPPPNVPALDPDTPGFEKLTLKQQLETHRNKESCRDCHAMIDPYGIAFENFDAAGIYQTMNKEQPVDALSVLPDGVEVNGIDDLKAYVIKQKPQLFTMSLVKHLYSYSLGREVRFSDEETLQTLVKEVKENNYSMRSLIKSIVNHPTFKQL
ncbi:DUF1592 domain-containing protein [Thalassotalea crassostreae]|uniref:DUF1592 domain-containing protein n=1 Tax=Thalassotalea crassostreae TaxID=1763536 RepID=UPI000838FD91|nr:DUF1592 domain-containing protein [Thalassotalea crassostreae]